MPERSSFDALDQAVEAVLSRGEERVRAATYELSALAGVAAELRDMASPSFKERLRAELSAAAARMPSLRDATERSEDMATTAEQATSYIREGFRTVTPYLQVERASELLGFVKEAFGATEIFRVADPDGGLRHAETRIGDSMLMMGGSPGMPFPSMPTSLHIYVEDADAAYRRALEAGAASLYAPMDQPYGDREAGVKDPAGNDWYIATRKEGKTHVPEGLGTVTNYLHPRGAAGLIAFLEQAFGAQELFRAESPEGVVHHAKVRIGSSVIEMGEARGEWQPRPAAIYLYVPDVDATYQQAVRAGAVPAQPPADQPYGDRVAQVNDPAGNIWYIATHKREVAS
jgi:PhnB protein